LAEAAGEITDNPGLRSRWAMAICAG
jgi:hypothetical protein